MVDDNADDNVREMKKTYIFHYYHLFCEQGQAVTVLSER